MLQFRITKPDYDQFVNRRLTDCYVCKKKYIEHVDGVYLSLVRPSDIDQLVWFDMVSKYIPYHASSMCSEECATFYILSVMGPDVASK